MVRANDLNLINHSIYAIFATYKENMTSEIFSFNKISEL